MADVAVVGDRVVLTYAVPGHYDRDTTPKSSRSTREGVAFAADFAGVPEDARIYAELVYPHFHGDTVHFGARPASGPAGARALPGRPVRRRRATTVARGARRRSDRGDRSRRRGRAVRRQLAAGRRRRARPRRRVAGVRRRARATRAGDAPGPAVRAVRQGRRRPGVRDPLPAGTLAAPGVICRCATRRPGPRSVPAASGFPSYCG